MMEVSDRQKLMMEVWSRIGRSPDGRIARGMLVDRLMLVISPNVSDSAVRVDQGERNFAMQLLKLFDEDAATDGQRTEPDARVPGGRKPVGNPDTGTGLRRRVPRRE